MKIKRLAPTIMIFLLICSVVLCGCSKHKSDGGVSSALSNQEIGISSYISTSSESNSSNSSQLNTSNQQQYVEKVLKRPEKTVFVNDLHANLTSLDIKGENPQIKITWHTYSEKEIEITRNFDVLYFNGDKYVSCAKKDVEFSSDTFTLHYHEGGRCSNSEEVVYSLKDFDVSKEGKYRFVLPMGEKEYIEFSIVKTPVYDNIEFQWDIFRIGYIENSKCKVLNDMSYERKNIASPFIRIQNKSDVVTFVEKTAPLTYGIRDGVYNEEFQAILDKYDDKFFETKRLYILYITASSGSIRHSVTGVEEEENTLNITITRKYPQVGTCDMAGYAVAIAVNKEDAAKYDYFNIKYHHMDYYNIVNID